jgi:hypothetical protein
MAVSTASVMLSTMEFMEGNGVVIVYLCSGGSDASELVSNGSSFNNDSGNTSLTNSFSFSSACVITC